jgi:hypothetical protein
MTGFSMSVGGTAVVCCVHDREKRQVTTEAHVAELGRQVGQVYDPRQHKLHMCACCQNLFVDPTDIPRFCRSCQGPLRHEQPGPLPDPIGEV